LVLVPELHGNAVVAEGEQFLSQSVGLFFLPFLDQELFDLVGALEELVPVPPDCVWGVCCRDSCGIPRSVSNEEILHGGEEILTECSTSSGRP
jgi:hypothetical protein